MKCGCIYIPMAGKCQTIKYCALHAAAPDLLAAASGAAHLCRSLLAVREGATDELIREIVDALDAAIAKAEGGA